jgi:dihydrofolate reductase
VDASPEGDTRFPQLNKNQWCEVARERREADEKNLYAMEFVVLQKNQLHAAAIPESESN